MRISINRVLFKSLVDSVPRTHPRQRLVQNTIRCASGTSSSSSISSSTLPNLTNEQTVQCRTSSKSSAVRSVQTQRKTPYVDAFRSSDVEISLLPPEQRAQNLPPWDRMKFGHHCADHMVEVAWKQETGWDKPCIVPVHNLSLHPYSKVFHYAQELFEGMKAYRGPDNKIRLFRPDKNMARMRVSAARLCLPDFNGDELIGLIKQLLKIDTAWVPPYETGASLYIRPTLIGIEPTLGVAPANEALLYVVTGPVGPYFTGNDQLKPISLYASAKHVRAWPGGSGDKKLGSNYAPTLSVQQEAIKHGQQQVLWLYGPDHQLTEVGTMNIFVFFQKRDGSKVLVTPPLNEGVILPGVTRQSLIELTRSWNEFEVVERAITMAEVQQLIAENRLLEIFGAGTACVVCPVGEINFEDKPISIAGPSLLAKRLLKELTDIQYGVVPHEWSVVV